MYGISHLTIVFTPTKFISTFQRDVCRVNLSSSMYLWSLDIIIIIIIKPWSSLVIKYT